MLRFNMKTFQPKLFSTLKNYSASKFASDIIAGIIVAIIALPLSIALAISSGVSPEKGLITAIIAGFCISFFGGSDVQIGGPTGAFVVIICGIIGQYGVEGLIISTLLAVAMAVLVIYLHRKNMSRIMNKTESKISFKKKKSEEEEK